MFNLSGKVALVTGAGQGVGAGIAAALASQGASVAVNDVVAERAEVCVAELSADLTGNLNAEISSEQFRSDSKESDSQASQAAPASNPEASSQASQAAPVSSREANISEASSPKIIAAPFDVTSLEEVQHGVASVAEQLGPIDILVNNAGNAGANTFTPTPFSELSPDQWQKFIDVNLYGVLNCTKAVISSMQDRRWGRIITISSGAGQSGLNIGVSIYGAAKGGSIAFMRHIAIENAKMGITANSLALGLMDTIDDPSVTEHLARAIPAGRLGSPEDIGAACVWLASEEAAWVTNQTININGGSLAS